MVNGRISDRTARRYAALRLFFRFVLHFPDQILAQTAEMRDRLHSRRARRRAGACGRESEIRFRAKAAASAITRLSDAEAKVWIAASTSADDRIAEEDAVIDGLSADAAGGSWSSRRASRSASKRSRASWRKSGLPFVRPHRVRTPRPADVLLLDTIGELSGLFALADVVFVGGTLADRGGHNILEPAFFGKPIVIGPHMENFREIADDFRAADAVREIRDASELPALYWTQPRISEWALVRESAPRRSAERWRSRDARDQGGLRTLAASAAGAVLPAFLLLWPFAQIWRIGGARRRAKALRDQQKLPDRVISIGNITVGGTG